MRVKSEESGGYIIYAVSGTNTISFAIDFRNADTKGLLGFAVERIDNRYGERKYVDGFKVFKEIISQPSIEWPANTYSHPVQSFVWDDFACYDDVEYEYLFYPLKGTPKNIDRSAFPIHIVISTEPMFSSKEHDIFFNRGVASSQAYARKFFNAPPDAKHMNESMLNSALGWLSRHLDDAIIKFINQAESGDTLLGCFYEFHYKPVLTAFKDAIDRGVKVQIIIDAKKNSAKDKPKGTEGFPRDVNFEALKAAHIPITKKSGYIIRREAKKNDIQHNKFMVLIEKLPGNLATQVWTGSTNISSSGIHGQTNVGHWVRNKKVAEKFLKYWEVLSKDPGGKDNDDRTNAVKKNEALKKEIELLQETIEFKSWNDIPKGVTPVFSPRSGCEMLESYFKMMDSAKNLTCITLAFGINKACKKYLVDNTDKNHISFILLEKEDKPGKKSKDKFVYVGAKQNVYEAWGSYIEDNLYHWVETNAIKMGLATHIAYIHSKFLLVDPLGNDPVIVTGSANFSDASTECNDENMIIIRGDKRAADIYFPEFNRLFNHYYFRSVYNKLKNKNAEKGKNSNKQSIFLSPDDSWLSKYKPGSLRYKRVDMITKMEGFK